MLWVAILGLSSSSLTVFLTLSNLPFKNRFDFFIPVTIFMSRGCIWYFSYLSVVLFSVSYSLVIFLFFCYYFNHLKQTFPYLLSDYYIIFNLGGSFWATDSHDRLYSCLVILFYWDLLFIEYFSSMDPNVVAPWWSKWVDRALCICFSQVLQGNYQPGANCYNNFKP